MQAVTREQGLELHWFHGTEPSTRCLPDKLYIPLILSCRCLRTLDSMVVLHAHLLQRWNNGGVAGLLAGVRFCTIVCVAPSMSDSVIVEGGGWGAACWWGVADQLDANHRRLLMPSSSTCWKTPCVSSKVGTTACPLHCLCGSPVGWLEPPSGLSMAVLRLDQFLSLLCLPLSMQYLLLVIKRVEFIISWWICIRALFENAFVAWTVREGNKSLLALSRMSLFLFGLSRVTRAFELMLN
jgi:hypothetical protein